MHMQKLAPLVHSRQVGVGVIGLGYVGLPLAATFARQGVSVLGFDVDTRKIAQLAKGTSYIGAVTTKELRQLVKAKTFTATADFARLAEPDVLIICVPTPLTPQREPDLSYIENTARMIARHGRKGQLVVLESTTYPGTTREIVLPILTAGGRKHGRDFLLAFSPEREDPGRRDHTTATIPKVVGGLTPTATKVAAAVYALAVKQVVPVKNCEIAEASKILENTFRSVNIALVNELKMLFDRMGIDIWEVIAAARTKPFGFMPFYPGPGLGGHCIPIDPFYLSWKAREYGMTTRFIELAGEVNVGMPHYVLGRLAEALNRTGQALRGAKIMVLGLAYKPDIDDPRESPALEIIALLQQAGAKVCYNDPHIPQTPKMRRYDLKLRSTPITARTLAQADAVIIATNHSAYDYELIVKASKLVVDTRNACAAVKTERDKIIKA